MCRMTWKVNTNAERPPQYRKRAGFTGTRHGLTARQGQALDDLISELNPTEFHHGNCVGADAAAAAGVDLFRGVDLIGDCQIVAHPGRSANGTEEEDAKLRAELTCNDDVRPVKTHFARNRDIVAESDYLIACPSHEGELTMGGTAYTVNYALKKGYPVFIVRPSGEIERPQLEK